MHFNSSIQILTKQCFFSPLKYHIITIMNPSFPHFYTPLLCTNTKNTIQTDLDQDGNSPSHSSLRT